MNEEMLVLDLDESHGSVIKNHEFAHCSALKIINLPKGIEVIEERAQGGWVALACKARG